jgi:16S rRNA (guanine527-N7)-methyltransferase
VRLPKEAAGRLAALEEQYELPPGAVDAVHRIVVFQAGDHTAPTTVRDPAAAVDRHVADSLAALALPEVKSAGRIADIGAGAGWPGLALAAALPSAQVALVESASRHCRYLERVLEHAELPNVSVVHARAEAWPAGVGAHDLVTARALASLAVLCEYAAPLLDMDGVLVAWKGEVPPPEAADGAAAAAELGLTELGATPVAPFPGAQRHTLHRFRKTARTPSRFPRRPGMATKRPLTAP